MVTRTFLSKCNTISNASKENFGLNPICSLNYGSHISRVLIYFDTDSLKEKIVDGTYKVKEKLSHRLKMTNCGSVDIKKFFEKSDAQKFLSQKRRASSFDVIAFKIPKTWDAGNGFDNSTDFWFLGYKSVSKDGSTWEKSMNGVTWAEPVSGTNLCDGIYSSDFLWDEYEKWGRGEESIVVGRQHFDYGNENLDIDITDYVNSIIFDKEDKERNYGLCLAFSPKLEETDGEDSYINFFTNNTNTFFAPYVETRYNSVINDDRYKFYLGKKNRLYFYSVVNGKFTELDESPTCSINGENSPVFSETKGIYYTEVKLPKNEKERVIMSDIWSNIKVDGEDFDEVELDFVTLPFRSNFSFGEEAEEAVKLNPIISGINDDQKLYQGDIREIIVSFRVPYTTSDYEIVDESYYRIYAKDADREIDVIDWDSINTLGRKNSFTLNTNELLPQDYYVDIKAIIGRETLIFKDKLHFKITNNITDMKH